MEPLKLLIAINIVWQLCCLTILTNNKCQALTSEQLIRNRDNIDLKNLGNFNKLNQFGKPRDVDSEQVSRPIEIRVGFLVSRQRKSTTMSTNYKVDEQQAKTYSTRPGRLLSHVFNFAIDKINSIYSMRETSADEFNRPPPPPRPPPPLQPSSSSSSSSSSSLDTVNIGRARRGDSVQSDNYYENDNNNEKKKREETYGSDDLDLRPDKTRRASAQPLIDTDNNDNVDKLISFKPIVAETYGDESESIRQTIDLISHKRVHVIFGPQDTCQVEPIIASIYNVPMISHYCSHYYYHTSTLSPPIRNNPSAPAPAAAAVRPIKAQQQTTTTTTSGSELGVTSQLAILPPPASGTFIQTKPPIWKIVRRVVALISRLLNGSGDTYPQQLVLLYYKDPPAFTRYATAAAALRPQQKHHTSASTHTSSPTPSPSSLSSTRSTASAATSTTITHEGITTPRLAPPDTATAAPDGSQLLRNGSDGVGEGSAANRTRTKRYERRGGRANAVGSSGSVAADADDGAEAAATLMLDSVPLVSLSSSSVTSSSLSATNGANQYKIIGKLLEIKLKQLVDEQARRRRSSVIDNGEGAIKGGASAQRRRTTIDPRQPSPIEGERVSTEARSRRRHHHHNYRSQRRHSLTVLNWHTTYYYGYMKNPFRNILRRHIFQQKQQRWQSSSSSSSSSAAALNQSTSPWTGTSRQQLQHQCDLLRNDNNDNYYYGNYDGDGDKTGAGANGPVLEEETHSTAAIYIVVGHYYEHLGLMLALDELGLLENEQASDAIVADTDQQQQQWQRQQTKEHQQQQQEHPSGGGGGEQQKQAQQQFGNDNWHDNRRRRRPRRASIVVGVDIEPHDEGDDSVRFLRGLLMDGDLIGGRATARAESAGPGSGRSANGNNNNRERQEERFYDLNSLASKYNNYIGVVPTQPSKSIGLLDEMRLFYNKTNQAGDEQRDRDYEWTGGGGGEQSSMKAPNSNNNNNLRTYNSNVSSAHLNRTSFSNIYDSNLLALKMLQFARLPIEAYYLYDSVMLIGAYFNECLAQTDANLAECSRGDRVFNWFANRRYSNNIGQDGQYYSSYFKDNARAQQQQQQAANDEHQDDNRFDSLARAEGSYTLLARRLPPVAQVAPPPPPPPSSSSSSQVSVMKTIDLALAEHSNLHPLDTWPDDEFDIVPIGQFKQLNSNSEQQQLTDDDIIEFNVDSTSIASVWLPLWCSSSSSLSSSSSSSSSTSFAAETTFGNNNSTECSDYQRDTWNDEAENEDGPLVSLEDEHMREAKYGGGSSSHAMNLIVIAAVGLVVGFIILTTTIVLIVRRRAHRCGGVCLNLNCLSGGCEKSFEQDNMSWFSADDAKNFLHIVHNLLLMPDSLINEAQEVEEQEDEADYDDDDDGEQGLPTNSEGEKVAGCNRTPQLVTDGGTKDLGQTKSSRGLANLSYRRSKALADAVSGRQQQQQFTSKGVESGACVGQPNRRRQREQKQSSTVLLGKYVREEDEEREEDGKQQGDGLASVAIDLHCYMFPFPSCKFVHWLTALHKLKEMLFKYQFNLSGGYPFADKHDTIAAKRFGRAGLIRKPSDEPNQLAQSDDYNTKRRFSGLFCCCTGNRLMFQLPILFESTKAAHQMSAKNDVARISVTDKSSKPVLSPFENNPIDAGKMHRKSWWWWCSNNTDYNTMDRNVNLRVESFSSSCSRSSATPTLNRTNFGQLNFGNCANSFFTDRHKYSATLRLLLNKYKSTNECLCNLNQLQHVNVVKLLGVTLLSGANHLINDCGGKLAQLIVEQTERANLRQELLKLESNLLLNSNCRDTFKPVLWRTLLIDLLEGLEYIHDVAKIGFHGELNATNCLITADWRLKLAGFHVNHMRRSFGYYELRVNNANGRNGATASSDNTYNNNNDNNNSNAYNSHLDSCGRGGGGGGVNNYADHSIYSAPEVLLLNNSPGINCSMNIVANKRENSATTLLSVEEMQLADFYSCGFVIYELLVSQEPWSCLNETRAHQHDGNGNGADHSVGAGISCDGGGGGGGGSIRSSKLLVERVKVDSSFRPPMSRLDKILPILDQQVTLPSSRCSALYNTTTSNRDSNLLSAAEHYMQSWSSMMTSSSVLSLSSSYPSSAQHLKNRTQFRGAASATENPSNFSNAVANATSSHYHYNAIKHPSRANRPHPRRLRHRCQFDLDRLKGLIESCWSYSPKDRPGSVRALRALLSEALQGTLVGPLAPNSATKAAAAAGTLALRSSSKLRSAASFDVSKLYTKLLEQSSRERKLALINERQLHNQLSVALLPNGFDTSNYLVGKQQQHQQKQQCTPSSLRSPVSQHDCVYLCFFRFILLPNNTNNNSSSNVNGRKCSTSSPHYDVDQYNILNGILHQLDDLVDSYRGHVHLWDSQVDSMLRFMLCANEPSRPPSTTKTNSRDITYSRVSLVTTFAFELIDLANKWQAKFDGQIQVKCALHLGPAHGTCLLPDNYYTVHTTNTTTTIPQQTTRRYHVLNLARYILSGPTIQCADILEQTGQPQRIHISGEFRAKLLEISKHDVSAMGTTSHEHEFDLGSLIPSLLGATSTGILGTNISTHQQGYVILKRSCKIQAKNFDCETYWLLNGPRVTCSQRLMLPLIGS